MIAFILVGVVSAVIGLAAGSYITWRGVHVRLDAVLMPLWEKYYADAHGEAQKAWHEITDEIRKVL